MTAATQSLGATAWKDSNVVPNIGAYGPIHFHRFPAVTVATTAIDEIDDIFELATVPAGIKILGFMITATDMDTNVSPALIYKMRVAAADTTATGITTGQSAATAVHWCAPVETTALSVIDAKVTAAAGTAAQGTVTLGIFYTAV